MLLQLWAAIVCPLGFGVAGWELTRDARGIFAALVGYSAALAMSLAARVYQRNDYWASKLAMVESEIRLLSEALAVEYRRSDAGSLSENNQPIIDAYRSRLALLRISTTAIRAGFASEKASGWPHGHSSARRAGLLAKPA